jgi:hypothetical protein
MMLADKIVEMRKVGLKYLAVRFVVPFEQRRTRVDGNRKSSYFRVVLTQTRACVATCTYGRT